MRQPRWKIWREARDTRGAEIAETAMVLPLVFMMVIAIFWFGQAFRIYGTITHAAREGARNAVAPACTTCAAVTPNGAAQNAVTAVNSALSAAKLDPNQVQLPSPVPTFPACGGGAPVSTCYPTVTSPTSNVCVQFNVQLSSSANGGVGTCGTSVSFGYKYPYHFLIPLTTLDLGNMSLPAQAQMRVETQ
jgi:Flp pilus assembly protein TadG